MVVFFALIVVLSDVMQVLSTENIVAWFCRMSIPESDLLTTESNTCSKIAFKRMDFSTWLLQEMDKRQMTQADLARASGLSTGGVTNLINNSRRPSVASLLAIAKGLRLPPEEVYRAAGVLPKKNAKDRMIERFEHALMQMSPEEQERWVEMVELAAERQARKDNKNHAET